MLKSGRYESKKESSSWDSYDIIVSVKETEKAYKFTLEKMEAYCPPSQIEMLFKDSHSITIRKNRSCHAINEWSDGTFTIYPFRSGIPFYFEPVENNPTEMRKQIIGTISKEEN